MGSVSKVVIHLAGVRDVCNQPEVLRDLQTVADRVCSRADAAMPESGYVRTEHHKTVVGETHRGIQEVSVYTNTNLAKAMQAKHDTLTKALTGG